LSQLVGRFGHARVVVLTVISAEFLAMQRALSANDEVGTSGAFTSTGSIAKLGGKPVFPFVVMQLDDRSNTPAASSLRRAVEYFRPEFVLLVGVAGGIIRLTADGLHDGPALGDLYIATYVHYAEYSKSDSEGRHQRYYPIQQPSINLVNHALAISRNPVKSWLEGIQVSPPAEAHVPSIHSGEVVVVEAVAGDPEAESQRFFIDHFDHAGAVEMESNGVGRGLADLADNVHYAPQWLTIRGISDHVFATSELSDVDNHEERATWKPYASAVASAFAKALVYRLLSTTREEVDGDPGAVPWPPNPAEIPVVSAARETVDTEGAS
jgi:nucleoside phosphorylase